MDVTVGLQAFLDDGFDVPDLAFDEPIRLWMSGAAGGVLYARFLAEFVIL